MDIMKLQASLSTRGYELGKQIGKGGFATVYAATRTLDGKPVAIKVVERSDDERDSLTNEVNATSELSHPNIIKTYEVFEGPRTCFFVMEFMKGGDMLEYVNQYSLTEDDARLYFTQICLALKYAHSRGWVHLDMKLENILLSGTKATLCDWGLSRRFRKNAFITTSKGSIHYSAPELLAHSPFEGPEADVWSMGVVLYAMLTNRLPWVERTAAAMRERIIYPPSFHDTGVSEAAQNLIRRMLDVDRRTRITMDEVLRHEWVCPVTPVAVPPLPLYKLGMLLPPIPHTLPRLNRSPRIAFPSLIQPVVVNASRKDGPVHVRV